MRFHSIAPILVVTLGVLSALTITRSDSSILNSFGVTAQLQTAEASAELAVASGMLVFGIDEMPLATAEVAIAESAIVKVDQPSAAEMGERATRPVQIEIPTIGLSTRIIPVGLNLKREMDVPDGSTQDVGWYKYGPIPGRVGSAVVDAHVYAAFENLRFLKIGESVYVTTETGEKLRFIVRDTRVYELGDLTPAMLFGRKDARRLNLITCAGQKTADGSTYTHRLVVYAELAENQN